MRSQTHARQRARLEELRTTTQARLLALTAEVGEIVAASTDANGDDEHDPEGATIAFERSRTDALAGEARAELDQLDRALDRLEAGSYGTCVGCGGPIGAERLEALPATTRCISCARSGRA